MENIIGIIILLVIVGIGIAIIFSILGQSRGYNEGFDKGWDSYKKLFESGKQIQNFELPKKIECDVCGENFELSKNMIYTTRDCITTGIAALAGGSEPKNYNTVNCPHCGCQKILQEIKREVDCDKIETYEEEENENK